MFKRYGIAAAASLMFLSACSTVTIHPETSAKLISQPTYEESKDFFLLGLIGEERVDVRQICGERQVQQMQSKMTLQDGLLTGVTLGIYSPHSVRVWCQ